MENRLGFANYTGNLVTSRLGDLCERIMRKNSENQSDLPLTISSIDGLVDQRDYFNKVVAAKDMSGYYLLKRGEFAYNKSYSVGYDYGTIKRLNKYDEGCLSTLYICFAIKSNAIDSNYLECFFDSLVWYKDMANVCTEGARNHGLLNVDIEEFFNIKVVYPADIEEQKKTAKILNNLDEKIKAEKTNVEKLKALKSSMLTKMFPKEGESVPELRFKGFTDPWEQRKLGELAEIVGGGTPSTSVESYWDGDIDWYAPAEIGEQIYLKSSQRKITEEGLNKSSAKVLPVGTVLFTSRAGIGKTAILLKEGCTNQGFQSIVPNKNKLDSYFVFTRSEELKRYGETVGAGSTFVEVSGKQMANMELMMPTTMDEQQKIGEYFSNLDHLITLHQRKYEKLLDVKKAFLEKMIGGDN